MTKRIEAPRAGQYTFQYKKQNKQRRDSEKRNGRDSVGKHNQKVNEVNPIPNNFGNGYGGAKREKKATDKWRKDNG